MRDPWEGVAPDGTITTGADRRRVPAMFEPVLAEAVSALIDSSSMPGAAVLLYGSVATGQARPGRSDVDLLTVDVDPAAAREIATRLSARFGSLCRAVAIGPAMHPDFDGDGDAAYGNRVFVRHYCVRLAGPDLARGLPSFPADARAARGFNGDFAAQADRWRSSLGTADPAVLGRRIGRKTLLAVAGLVSVQDATWTTDRSGAAARWAQVRPELAVGLARLLRWADGIDLPGVDGVHAALDDIVAAILADFEQRIGRWR